MQEQYKWPLSKFLLRSGSLQCTCQVSASMFVGSVSLWKYYYPEKVCAGSLPADHPGQHFYRDTFCETTVKLACSCSIIQHCLSTSISGRLDTKRDQAVLNTFAVSCGLTADAHLFFYSRSGVTPFYPIVPNVWKQAFFQRNNKQTKLKLPQTLYCEPRKISISNNR